MQIRTTAKWMPYLLAVLATIVASLIGGALIPVFGDNVMYVTFFAAVTFAAWYGGLAPGLFATLLTFLVANLLFVSSQRSFMFSVPAFTYLFVCLAIACFSEAMQRALRQAEASAAQVVSLVESITDGFIAIDRQGNCTYMNPAAKEFHRVQGRAHAMHRGAGLFPYSTGATAEAKLKTAQTEQVPVSFEILDGQSRRWFEVQAAPAAEGGLAIHFRDITDRKLARLALVQSEERLRLAQEGANAGLWDWDLEQGKTTWSQEFYDICGLSHAVVPSSEAFIHSVHPTDRAAVQEAVSQVLKARTPLDIQYRTIHPRHGMRWIAQLGRTTVDESGRPVRMSGIALDITERKRAEENLRFFSEAGTALSALVDLESTMQKIARLAVPFFADWCVVDILSPRDQIERIAFAHQDREKESILKELVERSPLGWNSSAASAGVLRSGKPQFVSEVPEGFIDAVARDEHHRRLFTALDPISYIIVPLLVREKAIGTISFVSSESGRHYSTGDLEVANELARRAATAIDNARLYRELKQAHQQKDDFLAMLAHELRNPLAAVLYANETLKLTDHRDNPAVEVIDRQVASLSHLIDDLLDVSRITQDKIQLKKEFISAATVVERSVATASPQIEERGHQLTLDVADEAMPLFVDPTRVEQILVNLLNNAAKYTAEGGRIVVRAFPRQGWAVFEVRDTGVGIPAEMLPRVFELFTQVEQSLDRSQGGLGIGLTVVRKLVEMHGGRVRVQSEGADLGSQFTVELPLSEELATEPCAPEQSTPDVGSQKVLVVDDNVDTAESISSLLKVKGYTAAVAHDGYAALRVARSFTPDVVLLDLGLPGLDGYRVAETLRSEVNFANVRLIALSGYGQPADRQRSREAGFNEHLVKPVALQKLLSILSAH
jgi:PAS domain S-box-containing protein